MKTWSLSTVKPPYRYEFLNFTEYRVATVQNSGPVDKISTLVFSILCDWITEFSSK